MNNVPAAVRRRFYKVLSFKRVYLDFYLSLEEVTGQSLKIRQKHRLPHQLFIQSAPFYKSLYQLFLRRHYAVLFLRRWDRSFCGRHDGWVHARRDVGTRAADQVRFT